MNKEKLIREIKKHTEDKRYAIKDQDYEKAAEARDDERTKLIELALTDPFHPLVQGDSYVSEMVNKRHMKSFKEFIDRELITVKYTMTVETKVIREVNGLPSFLKAHDIPPEAWETIKENFIKENSAKLKIEVGHGETLGDYSLSIHKGAKISQE